MEGNSCLPSAIARCISGTMDPLPATRIQALRTLHNMLFSEEDSKHIPLDCLPASAVTQDQLIKPLLRRFSDASEKCRFFSIFIVTEFLMQAPHLIFGLLPYIFPVVSDRFPLQTILPNNVNMQCEVEYKGVLMEPSEEIRLLLIRFVHNLLKQAVKLIRPFASDIASILMCAATDKDPDVLLEVFSTMESFTKLFETNLKPVAKNLIHVTLPALCHNRSRVRVASLLAIQRLVLCGSHESIYELTAYQDPNIIPIKSFYHPIVKTQYLAVLASDPNVRVRETLIKTVSCWLLELQERKEHEVRLLPYILHGFNDENSHIQELSFNLMEQIGEQYESENMDDIKDVMDYLSEDIKTIDFNNDLSLPHVFRKRPCLGSRIMVKRCFGILLHAICNDLQAWQDEPKVLSARLLYVLLMFVEENVTMHLQSLLTSMMKVCTDPLVEPKIAELSKLLGFFIDPSAYLELLIPRIDGSYDADLSIQDTGKALKILSHLLQGSRPQFVQPHISELCSTLTNYDLMTSRQQLVHESILSIMEVIVREFDESCKNEIISVLWIFLNCYAVGEFRQCSCRKRIDQILETLSRCFNFESVNQLIASIASSILELSPKPQTWSLCSLDWIILFRLLEESSFMDDATFLKLFHATQEYVQLSCNDKAVIYRPIFEMLCKPWSKSALCCPSLTTILFEREEFGSYVCTKEDMDPSFKLVDMLKSMAHECVKMDP